MAQGRCLIRAVVMFPGGFVPPFSFQGVVMGIWIIVGLLGAVWLALSE